jgi:hypothetical protein
VSIAVIASSGASTPLHILEAFAVATADVSLADGAGSVPPPRVGMDAGMSKSWGYFALNFPNLHRFIIRLRFLDVNFKI